MSSCSMQLKKNINAITPTSQSNTNLKPFNFAERRLFIAHLKAEKDHKQRRVCASFRLIAECSIKGYAEN